MLLFVFVASVFAYDWESKLFISSPLHLASYSTDLGGIRASSAENFGRPKFGGSLFGRIYADFANLDGCNPFLNSGSWERPFIVLVQRSTQCSVGMYVKPSQHAQQIGAMAVIFVNNRNWGSSMDPRTTAPTVTNDTIAKTLLTQILIGLDEGMRIIQSLNASEVVKGGISWEHPQPSQTVEVILVQSTQNNRLDSFRRQFMQFHTQFGNNIIFQPRYYIEGNRLEIDSSANCIRGGRYCNQRPVEDFEVPGREVVIEHWYELQVWEYAKMNRDPGLFWDFVIFWENRCTGDCRKAGNTCHSQLWSTYCRDEFLHQHPDLMSFLNSKFNNDVQEWDLPDSIDILEAELELQMTLRGDALLAVNGQSYRGTMECHVSGHDVCSSNCPAFEFICSAFPSEQRPAICGGGLNGCVCSSRDIGGICGGNGRIDPKCGTYYDVPSEDFNECESCASQYTCSEPFIFDSSACSCVADPDNCAPPLQLTHGVCSPPSDCADPFLSSLDSCDFPSPKFTLENTIPDILGVSCPSPLIEMFSESEDEYFCGIASTQAYVCPTEMSLRLGNCVLPPAVEGTCTTPFVAVTSPATTFSTESTSQSIAEITKCEMPEPQISDDEVSEENKFLKVLVVVITLLAIVLAIQLCLVVYLYIRKNKSYLALKMKYEKVEDEDVELSEAPRLSNAETEQPVPESNI